jgi:D-alanine--poly(phosphoribitol) ligase subunit 2
MQLSEVMSKLHSFVRTKFKVGADDADFNDDVHLFDYGYVDSFGAVEIITFVKSEFGVTISDKDLVIHPLNTIREISTLVHGRMAK